MDAKHYNELIELSQEIYKTKKLPLNDVITTFMNITADTQGRLP